jgi:uncharacterized protein
MQVSAFIRLAVAAAVVLVAVLLFMLLIVASNQALLLWERLQAMPGWLVALYILALAALALGSGWILWRLFWPRESPQGEAAVPDLQQLEERVQRYGATGVPVQEAAAELALLAERRGGGTLYLSLFGEISSGKSSLVRALVPEAAPAVGVLGGSTREVTHYAWEAPGGERILLADVAGFNLPEGGAQAGREEALRAHAVLYVCDGDLTRGQWSELEALRALGKPLLVALNKRDRYSPDDLAAIRTRLRERLLNVPVVSVQAGGREEFIRLRADGSEERIERERASDVSELMAGLRELLQQPRQELETRRERAVVHLAADKLDSALAEHRREQAEAAVDRYTRRAVVGALAAVAPGSDIVIQGALAAGLVRELAGIYEVAVREVDVDRFVDAARRKAGNAVPLALAVAGNGLKAFPGMGTLTGGLMHAVAYGLLFQSLGRAVAESLRTQGNLQPALALRQFEEELSEDLATRARKVAGMALEEAVRRR